MAKKRKRRKIKTNKKKLARRKPINNLVSVQPLENPDGETMIKLFGYSDGIWVRCKHCQRCYQVGEHREKSDGLYYCHYANCNADMIFDSSKWETILHFYPNFPEIPEKNTVYKIDIELSGSWRG